MNCYKRFAQSPQGDRTRCFLLCCIGLQLALSCRADRRQSRQLPGVKRTPRFDRAAAAHGRERPRQPPAFASLVGGLAAARMIGAAASWPFAARGQDAGRTYRLGFVVPSARESPRVIALFDELRLSGFVEG